MSPSLALYAFGRSLLVGFARVYWRLSVEGLENVPPVGAYILAPVHRSNVDFVVAASVTRRRLRYMGKDTLWDVPVLRGIISALGAFPVHRESADREAFRRCLEVLDGGEPLVVFPEGARQSGTVVREMYQGAAYLCLRAGVPVVPVGIGGSEAAMPKGSKLPRPAKIHLVVGAPLEPDGRLGEARTSRRRRGPSGQSALARGARVSRSEVRRLSSELHEELQRLFDQASAAAGR